MLHAGVADHRQWNNEFPHFAQRYRALRYDMRGYGRSEPVTGEFSHMADLVGLMDLLGLREPAILMGCSMGGQLAMDLAITHPERVKALIMVGSGPKGMELDVPDPALAEAAEEAYKAGDLDRVAELETRIWFDGEGRTPEKVNPAMRLLAYEMNRNALALEARGLGKRVPDSSLPAAEHLRDLKIPVLIIVGEHDTRYIQTAADYMLERLPDARKVIIQDAAHLANMDHPDDFRRIVDGFLEQHSL
jgi:pimeloyl-ACP methyl ester carboxylesterase